MDDLSPSQRHKNMQHIRSTDTKIEVRLRRALWKKGYRYRKNYKGLPGKPDIVLTKYRIAIFCDSEFFHGKDWPELEKRILRGSNSEYWYGKITKNMQRDVEVNQVLYMQGWTVLRFWGRDIEKHLDECIRVVDETVFETKLGLDT